MDWKPPNREDVNCGKSWGSQENRGKMRWKIIKPEDFDAGEAAQRNPCHKYIKTLVIACLTGLV